jgi:hypothetical protein
VFAACGIQLQLEAHHRQQRIGVSDNAALVTITCRILQKQRRARYAFAPLALASNSISPLRKNTHMRMGDECVSPTQPGGSLRNPQCEAGASSETKNGVAGGAKSLRTMSIDRGSKCDASLVSGRNERN